MRGPKKEKTRHEMTHKQENTDQWSGLHSPILPFIHAVGGAVKVTDMLSLDITLRMSLQLSSALGTPHVQSFLAQGHSLPQVATCSD